MLTAVMELINTFGERTQQASEKKKTLNKSKRKIKMHLRNSSTVREHIDRARDRIQHMNTDIYLHIFYS